MMTYLKHVGNKKHADLKTKSFDEIKALYEKVKRFDDNFITIGSTKDERKIKEMNEGDSDPDKKKKIVKEDVLAKVPAKQDVAEQGTKKRKSSYMKMIARKRKRPQPDVDSDDEHRKFLKISKWKFQGIQLSNGEGIELILWGDLKIMMESSIEVTDQEFKDGTVIHMLVERKYPLSKELLQRMLDFRLEVKEESTAALDLIRFIKQQLNEEVLNSPCFMVKSWLVQDQTVPDNMANKNVPAPTPTRFDDQMLPFSGIITCTNVDYAELMWEEFVQAIQTFLADKANLGIVTKKDKKTKPHVIPYCWSTKLIIYYLGRKHNINQRSGSSLNLAEDDLRLGNLKFVPKGKEDEVFGMRILKELITDNIRNAPYYNAYLEKVVKHNLKISFEEGGKKKLASKVDQSKKPATAKQSKPVSSKQPKPALAKKPKVAQEKPSEPSPTKHPKRVDDFEFNLQRGIQMSLESFQAHGQPLVDGVAFHKPAASGITQKLHVVEGKGKRIATNEQVAQSLLEIQMPKKKSTTDQYIFQRQILVAQDVTKRPSAQPEDDTSANVVHDTPSLADNKTTVAETKRSNSENDTKILHIADDQEHVIMEEDQAGLDPGTSYVALARPNPKPMHEDFIAIVYPQVHESLKHTTEEHVHKSSSRTLSSMKNLDAFTFGDQFINDKSQEDEPGRVNVETEVESMVIIPIHQASLFAPPLSTPIIDLSPPKSASTPVQELIFIATTTTTTTTTLLLPPLPPTQSSIDADLAARISALKKIYAKFEQKNKSLENITMNLESRVFDLELRDLPHKINQTIYEVVKESV
ncbi:hypothetical protein Tco_0088332 [Tanacetum coccineum]